MRAVMLFLILTVNAALICTVASHEAFEEILNERNYLLQSELDMMLGHDITLSDTEKKVNEIIMDLKLRQLDEAFSNPGYFNMSKHFFEYKDEVKETELYKIIQQMPKGAMLHAHDTGLLRPEYLLNITYWDDLYVCFEEEDLLLIFAADIPDSPCQTEWELVEYARYSSGNVEEFDEYLRKYFTLVVDNPREAYSHVNDAWHKFQKYFITTGSMLCYKPAWEQYFYDTLKALREDNVMFLEIRSVLPPLYDLEGNVYDSVATAESYKNITDQFVKDYPDFFGVKLIYAPMRLTDAETVEEYINIARQINKRLPGFLAGFDLVGQEDLGVPIVDFMPQLAEAREEFDYFFHAGETNWYGTRTDENLADAIVLGTRRIGHGYALIKHPQLLKEVVERRIALEVNVISNAVLELVSDVRNHPLASFLAMDLPVVISSDDPGVWEADLISHDYYVTFVGVASRHADLRLLKKLALNSLFYSTYDNVDKIVYEFEIRWTRFIDQLAKAYY